MPFANFPGKFGDISSHFGMIWRFATMADPLVVEWHSRDLDSLPNPREVAAVNDWLRNSNQTFQIMRDHPLHNSKILGGAFGMRISGSNQRFPVLPSRNRNSETLGSSLVSESVSESILGLCRTRNRSRNRNLDTPSLGIGTGIEI